MGVIMKYKLDISYPFEKMEKSKKRLDLFPYFKYYDRVPVNFCTAPRFYTRALGIDYSDIFRDVETQYEYLLQFAKFHIENIPSDFCTGSIIQVHPFFDNVVASSAFVAEVAWPKNETLHSIPTMKDISEIEAFKIPEPDAALVGRTIEWWHKMKELAEETEVTFNGQKGKVEVSTLNLIGLGPHMIAVDLAGTDFYWWMVEYPDECHQLLDKITKGLILIEENGRKIDPRPRGGLWIAEDSSQIMSERLFKEFTIPYTKALYEKFPVDIPDSRAMHMCGNSAHLHRSLVEDLQITSFSLFGCLVPPKVAARNLGGKVRLMGNIDPIVIKDGSKEEVKKLCMEALEEIAPCGGFMLSDGANVCPETPLENLAVFVEACEEYSKMHPELFVQE
ncbi:MAG: hypothetical protein FIA99_17755 [Ruminiclostridium sp.]|nr:hypothetical protein [Ruminiclostridium sp.]